MDRISALRNVEDALAAFEDGEADLTTTERRVVGVVRTYATAFAADGLAAYRVEGNDESVVVVAASPREARDRASSLAGVDPQSVEAVTPTD